MPRSVGTPSSWDHPTLWNDSGSTHPFPVGCGPRPTGTAHFSWKPGTFSRGKYGTESSSPCSMGFPPKATLTVLV